eukprot:scaffold22620_cov131-Cylindrotheca_fusiformis.AAC.6
MEWHAPQCRHHEGIACQTLKGENSLKVSKNKVVCIGSRDPAMTLQLCIQIATRIKTQQRQGPGKCCLPTFVSLFSSKQVILAHPF